MKPIGTVESCFLDKFGTPRQPGLATESRAFLRLVREVQPEFSLEGLAGFSHLWIIFIFHKNNTARFHAKVHPPRLNGKTTGLFSTRSPHRPNPIGLSLVKIEKIEVDGIWVSGIDIIDQTPILDIKPYLPTIESRPDASSGWTDLCESQNNMVEWSHDALQLLNEITAQGDIRNLKKLIEEVLILDPRPQVYKGYEGEDSPYRESHAVRLYNLDIHFQFLKPTHILVTKIVRL
ncbi:MAG: tRNA (N6-threonylcarbamoyladenosine(37)-N6)-methyltransferase TrmO [Bdellovibrionales bacterium]|nr:tRNA (N6-threonylcarbamoyladenosine(37)-N6)-methyltransferase TrmO [Bdellovibrionales bacterium]